MTARTLAEAAAEVLAGSRSSAPSAPMQKLPDSGSGLDAVTDLGGASFEDPQGGGNIGAKSASAVGQAAQPGPSSGKATSAPSNGVPADELLSQGTNDTQLADTMNKNVKPKMQPVPGSAAQEEVEQDGEVIEEEELTEEDIEAARKARWEDLVSRMKKEQPVKEDMDALFSGETLSEDFKNKATTIFEAAVLKRAVAVVESLEAEILEAASAAIDETRQELEFKIDGYLNLIAEDWVKDNEVAIESGLRGEVVEGFIAGLKNLFVEHYVEVPEDKVDVLAAQEEQIAELTARVNEAMNANVELTKKLNEGKKKEILNKVCEGLTATQAEKVRTLAEGVEFSTDADYSKKLGIIRESYINQSKVKEGQVALTEGAGPAVVEDEKTEKVDPAMALYLGAMTRTQIK